MRALPLILIAGLTLAVGPAAAVAAPADGFRRSIVKVGPGPPNGDFSQGVAGWEAVGGREPTITVAGSTRYLRLAANTTIVSSPLRVSGSAQTLRIHLRSRSRGGVLLVRALRANGMHCPMRAS